MARTLGRGRDRTATPGGRPPSWVWPIELRIRTYPSKARGSEQGQGGPTKLDFLHRRDGSFWVANGRPFPTANLAPLTEAVDVIHDRFVIANLGAGRRTRLLIDWKIDLRSANGPRCPMSRSAPVNRLTPMCGPRTQHGL